MRNLVLRNQVVFGTVNAGKRAFEDAIRDLEAFQSAWPEALGGLVSGRFAPDRALELLAGQRGGIKNVIQLAEAA